MIRSRAAGAWESGRPLKITEVDVSPPGPGEALVKLVASGVCRTDDCTHSGSGSEGLFPAILGHEGCGVVQEVGQGVTGVRPGDHMIPLYAPECRRCKLNSASPAKPTSARRSAPQGAGR